MLFAHKGDVLEGFSIPTWPAWGGPPNLLISSKSRCIISFCGSLVPASSEDWKHIYNQHVRIDKNHCITITTSVPITTQCARLMRTSRRHHGTSDSLQFSGSPHCQELIIRWSSVQTPAALQLVPAHARLHEERLPPRGQSRRGNFKCSSQTSNSRLWIVIIV